MTKQLTHKEVSARGGRSTMEKHPNQASEMGKKGAIGKLEKYGQDYFKRLGRKSTYVRMIKVLKKDFEHGAYTQEEYDHAVAQLNEKYADVIS